MSDDTTDAEYRGLEGTRPFAGAGWCYAEYRDWVSPAFIARLAARLNWRAEHRILDLGAGPAQLSLLVAPLVAEVVAIEPEPDMLDEGERRARFEDEVRAALADLGDLGELTVTMCDHALIGSR